MGETWLAGHGMSAAMPGHDEQEYLRMRFWGGRTHTRMINPREMSVAAWSGSQRSYGRPVPDERGCWRPLDGRTRPKSSTCPFDGRLIPPSELETNAAVTS